MVQNKKNQFGRNNDRTKQCPTNAGLFALLVVFSLLLTVTSIPKEPGLKK